MSDHEHTDTDSEVVTADDTDTVSSEDITDVSEQSGSLEYFPKDLPLRHQYLGVTEEVRGRTVLSAGEHIRIPILAHCDEMKVILIPGQILPLTFYDRADHLLIQTALEKDKIIGVLHIPVLRTIPNNLLKLYGTIAEICEVQNHEEHGTISLIAKGRQRFKVRAMTRNLAGVQEAIAEILPEIELPDPLESLRFPYAQRLDFSFPTTVPKDPKELRKLRRTNRLRKFNALQTPWPSWVYDMYDANLLTSRLVSEVTRGFQQGPQQLNIPTTPEELSFWCAKSLPLPSDTRIDVLSLHSPIQRLRHLLRITTAALQTNYVRCVICQSSIASMKKIFAMSDEGPQGTFVNPGGYVHEMITTRDAEGVYFSGQPSEEHSWFPGYAWQIMLCNVCGRHLGWKFKAAKSNLQPRKFYGLVHSSIAPERISELSDVETIM